MASKGKGGPPPPKKARTVKRTYPEILSEVARLRSLYSAQMKKRRMKKCPRVQVIKLEDRSLQCLTGKHLRGQLNRGLTVGVTVQHALPDSMRQEIMDSEHTDQLRSCAADLEPLISPESKSVCIAMPFKCEQTPEAYNREAERIYDLVLKNGCKDVRLLEFRGTTAIRFSTDFDRSVRMLLFKLLDLLEGLERVRIASVPFTSTSDCGRILKVIAERHSNIRELEVSSSFVAPPESIEHFSESCKDLESLVMRALNFGQLSPLSKILISFPNLKELGAVDLETNALEQLAIDSVTNPNLNRAIKVFGTVKLELDYSTSENLRKLKLKVLKIQVELFGWSLDTQKKFFINFSCITSIKIDESHDWMDLGVIGECLKQLKIIRIRARFKCEKKDLGDDCFKNLTEILLIHNVCRNQQADLPPTLYSQLLSGPSLENVEVQHMTIPDHVLVELTERSEEGEDLLTFLTKLSSDHMAPPGWRAETVIGLVCQAPRLKVLNLTVGTHMSRIVDHEVIQEFIHRTDLGITYV